MNLDITITHRLSPAIEQLLQRFVGSQPTRLATPDGKTVELNSAPMPAAEEAPPVKRPRKTATMSDTTAEARAAAAPPPPPLAIVPPTAAPIPTARVPGAGPSIEDVARMVSATMDRIGVPAMRAVLKKFSVGRVLELKPEQLPAFCAALQEAEQMVATS